VTWRGRVAAAAFVGFVLLVIMGGNLEWQRMPPGSHCRIRRTLFAVSDMGSSYDELEKALKLGDDYGVADLVEQGKVASLLAGTEGLIIEGAYSFKADGMYRRVRILGGPGYAVDPSTGKAFWVKRDWLIEEGSR
jgi:hypothetical protein